jgi:hypothetical protein
MAVKQGKSQTAAQANFLELLSHRSAIPRATLVHRFIYTDGIVVFKMGHRQGARRVHI